MSLNKEEIFEKVKKGISYEKIGREYGVSGSYIKKVLIKNGYEVPKRRKVNPKESFNKGKTWKKEKPKKRDLENGKVCVVCGKKLKGRQEYFCSKECKEKKYSEEGYHTKYARKQDKNGLTLKVKYIKQAGGCCSVCGYKKNLSALVFHHLDPSKKKFELTSRTMARKSRKEVEEEVKKCIVLCQNCHHELHYPEMDGLL